MPLGIPRGADRKKKTQPLVTNTNWAFTGLKGHIVLYIVNLTEHKSYIIKSRFPVVLFMHEMKTNIKTIPYAITLYTIMYYNIMCTRFRQLRVNNN